jgi:hypothetical protein
MAGHCERNDDPIRRMLKVNPLNGLFIALAGRDLEQFGSTSSRAESA